MIKLYYDTSNLKDFKNCINTVNPEQIDIDNFGQGDNIGDACDDCIDFDGDTVCDDDDICLLGDDFVDSDGDSVPYDCDICPYDSDDDIGENIEYFQDIILNLLKIAFDIEWQDPKNYYEYTDIYEFETEGDKIIHEEWLSFGI